MSGVNCLLGRRLDTGEERAFCRLWSASRAFYLLYRIEIVAVGHVSACVTHWVPEGSAQCADPVDPLGLETNNCHYVFKDYVLKVLPLNRPA